jgi:endonuclease YncB( thermonuclease family)
MDFKNSRILIILLPLITMQVFVAIVQSSSSWESDKTAMVSSVIDGDTFDTAVGDRIRLADIDAPELGESGYYAARDSLILLVNNKQVHLDIDDVSRTDSYGRLVCVVYVDYNSTHLENVNKALAAQGVAAIKDYENEFDPYSWNLFVPITETQKSLDPTFLIAILFIVALAVMLFLRKSRK